MECLDSHDDSIRLRALDLIVGMVTKKNLVEIVKRLVTHIEESESTCKCHTTQCHLSLLHVTCHYSVSHVTTLCHMSLLCVTCHYSVSLLSVTSYLSRCGLDYRDEVISKVISMCRQSNYQYITDFEW